MRYHDLQILFQEVPNEISITFTISGCKIRCDGCHSPYLWKVGSGNKLTDELYLETLEKYKQYATCVLFMGGEWHEDELITKLKIANEMNYNTCLYTGLDNVSSHILNELTWVKTGKWDNKLGGLDDINTNQKFIQVSNNKLLNKLFQK